MALRTSRMSVVRGRPPGLAGGIKGASMVHSSSLKSVGYALRFIRQTYKFLPFQTPSQSDIQPDTVHADTQDQSTPVFGLAYLLGIKLMPRIRNWKDLKLFRPDPTTCYTHLEELFSEAINWDLIETHLPDMLRVALSIKAGRLMASPILRKLGTASRKNKLYFAFRELGRVVRTGFLLQYLSDADLRALIQGATNKSEAFNNLIKWLTFGGAGVIAENDRDEQRKIIKYSHVVANCLIFHNCRNTHFATSCGLLSATGDVARNGTNRCHTPCGPNVSTKRAPGFMTR